MKKMWKKNNKAVSPVIATILMVAITVVLAAVLYVMVMGFGGDGGGQAPTASLTNSGNRLVLSISQSYDLDDGALTVRLTPEVAAAATSGFDDLETTTNGVQFVDAGDDGKVSVGDYFQLVGTETGALVEILWSSGGTTQVICEGEL